MAPPITVVVTTYNRRDLLRRCLEALLDQTAAVEAYEVLVVDDGSTDGTDAMVAELAGRHPHLRYSRHENVGRAATRNRGLALATGELLAYVDSDVVVVPGFVQAHLDAHARFRARTGSDLAFCQGLSLNVDRLEDVGVRPLPPADPSRAFFDTKNVSIPRHLLEEAGGFDLGFTEYGWEDLELGIRLKRRGVRILRSAKAAGYHYHPAFRVDSLPGLRRIEEQRGRMAARFVRMHPTWDVRLMVQLTPLHRALDAAVTLGGRLDEAKVAPFLRWCESRGWHALAALVAQAILNQYNLRELHRALA